MQPAQPKQPRFKVPSQQNVMPAALNGAGPDVSQKILQRLRAAEADPDPNDKPTFVGEGKWLREKATGIIHAWNDGMAMRSDLVEVVSDEDIEFEAEKDTLSTFERSYDARIPPASARL
jgi:hypothetical protein